MMRIEFIATGYIEVGSGCRAHTIVPGSSVVIAVPDEVQRQALLDLVGAIRDALANMRFPPPAGKRIFTNMEISE